MHIQFINSPAAPGFQVRAGQGPGQTKFFAAAKHGGLDKARRKAQRYARSLAAELQLPPTRRGILLSNNTSGISGIQFQWRPSRSGESEYLYVCGNYTDATGRPRAFAYSVQRNGLDGAMDKALAVRRKHGAPVPERAHALKLLRRAYRSAAG
jgi:hypothetical protein